MFPTTLAAEPAEDPGRLDLAVPSASRLPSPPQGGDEPGPLSTAHRLLRGRYPWALGIGALLAAGGVAAGVMIPKPLYKSVGYIDIAPKVNRVLYESDEKAPLPLFDAFVTTQAAVVSQRRVVDMAMSSPEWRAFNRGTDDRRIAEFQDNLKVVHPKYTQHLEVSFTDEDPEAAMVAVNQVIDAYMKVVKERETQSGAATIDALDVQKGRALTKLTDLRNDAQVVTDNLGELALKKSYETSIQELTKLYTMLGDLEVEIATAKAAHDAAAQNEGRVLTDDEIALRDPGLNQLLADKSKMETKVAILAKTYGERNPELFAARQELATLTRRVAERGQAFRAQMGGTPQSRTADLREKEERRGNLARRRDAVLEETRILGGRLAKLGQIEQERTTTAEILEEVKRRRDQIDVESSTAGRITILSYGERPVEPDTDRRIPFAILGATGGLALGFGTVIVWGMREGRLRHLVDVDAGRSNGRFLGMLPDVADGPPRPGEPDNAADVSDFCVHHIRTMLQLRGTSRPVVAVTSPTPGAGKTTLDLALGMSFAAAGSRTLLVDCDFVAHGLTSAVRSLVCDGVGRALDGRAAERSSERPKGIMSAIVSARRTSCDDGRIAELVSELRRRGETEPSFARMARALEGLTRNPPASADGLPVRRGVLGALEGRPLAECVVETGVQNLWILPACDTSSEDGDCLARTPLDRLIEECRDRFDAVLIDTGPVLGSIEAAVAVTVADAVVLVVSRGDRKPFVDDALGRIERIGADVAGVVFNRASGADVAKSRYSSRSQLDPAEMPV